MADTKPVLTPSEVMATVLEADQHRNHLTGTSNWAHEIGRAVERAVLAKLASQASAQPADHTAVMQQALDEDQIEAIAHRTAWRYRKSSDPHHSDTYTFNRHTLMDFAHRLAGLAGAAVQGEPSNPVTQDFRATDSVDGATP